VELATKPRPAELARWLKGDLAHLIHPHLGSGERHRLIVAAGEGCTIRDVEGREYLDATGGGLWANLVGHGRRELADAAREELARLGFFCTYWDFTNVPAIELAERLAGMTPSGLDKVFFTCGGSEGIEVAVKIARLHHHRGGKHGKDWILSRRQSYHGIGHAGSSATDFEWLRDGYGPQLPHFAQLTPPWPYRSELYDGADPTDFLVAELEARIEEIGAGRIAAMIGEPVMGVGGLLVPPNDYWPRVSEVLRRNDILLILDEVVTGYGRFGEWFAQQHYGVTADVVVTAKGITSGYFPFGAVLLSNEVGERIVSDDHGSSEVGEPIAGEDHGFSLGYTYTGHPAGAAVAMANLDLIENEGLRQRAPVLGRRLTDALAPLRELAVVGDVRGAGLLAAVELVRDRGTREPMPAVDSVTDALRREHGVIVRAAMNSTLVLSPSLVINDREIDRCAAALASVLERTSPEGEVR
jgi:adenosylmethionine-8-amino-7-oxononanoate aminotransferase